MIQLQLDGLFSCYLYRFQTHYNFHRSEVLSSNLLLKYLNNRCKLFERANQTQDQILGRVLNHEDGDYSSFKPFLKDLWNSLIEPAAPKLTIVFQWNPKIEVESTDFTENLLDTCNFRMLLTLQGTNTYLKIAKEDSVNYNG